MCTHILSKVSGNIQASSFMRQIIIWSEDTCNTQSFPVNADLAELLCRLAEKVLVPFLIAISRFLIFIQSTTRRYEGQRRLKWLSCVRRMGPPADIRKVSFSCYKNFLDGALPRGRDWSYKTFGVQAGWWDASKWGNETRGKQALKMYVLCQLARGKAA